MSENLGVLAQPCGEWARISEFLMEPRGEWGSDLGVREHDENHGRATGNDEKVPRIKENLGVTMSH